MENLQLLLCGGKGITSDLTVFHSKTDSSLSVYLGLALLEQVRSNEYNLRYKMLIGRLVILGFALSRLSRIFGHDPRTMLLWASALRSDDADFILRVFSGRSMGRKITEDIERYIVKRYLELRSNVRAYRRQIINEVDEIFQVKLSREVLRLIFVGVKENEIVNVPDRHAETSVDISAFSDDPSIESSEENTQLACSLAVPLSTKKELNDKHLPDLKEKPPFIGQLPFSGAEISETPLAIHHAGQVLFTPFMDSLFFTGCLDKSLLPQWTAQVLQGSMNIEQSSGISEEGLSRFIGPITPGLLIVEFIQHQYLICFYPVSSIYSLGKKIINVMLGMTAKLPSPLIYSDLGIIVSI